jgi:hypothetical protein
MRMLHRTIKECDQSRSMTIGKIRSEGALQRMAIADAAQRWRRAENRVFCRHRRG